LNPYGISGALYPLQQLGMLQSGSAFKAAEWGISEYQTPFSARRYSLLSGEFNLWQPILAMHIYAGLAGASFLFTVHRATRIEWATMALFGYTFWSAEKNFGYFFIATAPMVINRLRILGAGWFARRSPEPRFGVRARLSLSIGLLLLFVASQVLNGHYFARLKAPFLGGTGFSSAILPTGAAEFLRTAAIGDARILNSLDAGGYLSWQTGRKVFVDGLLETFGPDFFREYIYFKRLETLPALLAKWDPQVVVVPYSAIPEWVYYFREVARWRLVYFDARDAVFFSPKLGSKVPLANRPVAGADYPRVDYSRIESIMRDHVSLEHRGFGSDFFARHYFPSREIRLSAFHYWCGDMEASVGVALDGLAKATAPNPDLLLNAANALFELRHAGPAKYGFEQFLRLDRKGSRRNDPVRSQAIKRLREVEGWPARK
jgi:hypothetical protein